MRFVLRIRMKIGIDVRYLSHGLVGGIHTYMKNIMPLIMQQAHERGHVVVFYADTKAKFEFESHTLPSNVSVRLLPWRNKLSSFRHDVLMYREMAQDKLDVVHFAGNYGFAPKSWKTVVTLQDEINLLPLKDIYKGHKKELTVLWMFPWLHFASLASVRRASRVVTISDYSKRQIARFGNISPNKMDVVYHGCPFDIQRVTDEGKLSEVRQRLGLHKPFVLAEAFKNPGVLVRAWKQLPAEVQCKYEIVFFSRSENVWPPVTEAVDAGYAKLFVRPARTDLSALFSLCQAFVFPSWIEGFGIPLTEAMTCGAPIIASDRAAVPEVVGEAGLIMDAEDDRKLVDYLMRMFTQPQEQERLRQLGLARAPKFTWKNAAAQMLDVFERVAGD